MKANTHSVNINLKLSFENLDDREFSILANQINIFANDPPYELRFQDLANVLSPDIATILLTDTSAETLHEDTITRHISHEFNFISQNNFKMDDRIKNIDVEPRPLLSNTHEVHKQLVKAVSGMSLSVEDVTNLYKKDS